MVPDVIALKYQDKNIHAVARDANEDYLPVNPDLPGEKAEFAAAAAVADGGVSGLELEPADGEADRAVRGLGNSTKKAVGWPPAVDFGLMIDE